MLAACGLVACDGGGAEVDAGQAVDAGADAGEILDAGPIEPSLTVEDQTLEISTVVTIAAVASDAPAWIVVYEADGAIVGMTPLTRARHAGVAVALERRALSSEMLRAALHLDAAVIGLFEPAEDVPVLVGGVAIEASFSVTVGDGTPDVVISVSNVGDSAYAFGAADPSRYAIAPDPAAENPVVELRRGWRYEIFNPAHVSHPFELIRRNDGGVDEVHLSQRVVGTLHDDPTVAFEVVTPAVFRFTVSPSFEAAVDGYRCLVHPHMRGGVTYAADGG